MSKTYSTTIEITEEKEYPVTINAGLDLSAWITAGSTTEYPLNPSSYANFAALEADEEAIRQLMLVHNAVDYLATANADDALIEDVINSDICAKWINLSDYALDTLYANSDIKSVMDTADKYGYGELGLVGQVPVMTSNTAPYGEASTTSTNLYAPYNQPYYVFNGVIDASNGIARSYTYNDIDVIYHFISPICVKKLRVAPTGDNTGSGIRTWQLYGSSDGSTWLPIDEGSAENVYGNLTLMEFDISNNSAYSYYKFVAIGTYQSNGFIGIATLQFYAYAPLGNVPIMTSNTAPYGTASMSGNIYTNYEPYKAFDNNQSTSWLATYNSPVNSRLQYEFITPICPKKAKVVPYTSGNLGRLQGFKIQGYNGSTWEDLTSEISGVVTAEHEAIEVDITTNDYYTQLGLIVTKGGPGDTGIESLQFYGRELTEFIPTMTADDKPKGQANAKSVYNDSASYKAYKAFDGDDSTYWLSSNGETDGTAYVEYRFSEKVKPMMYKVKAGLTGGTASQNSIKIESSNDNFTSDITDLAGTLTFALEATKIGVISGASAKKDFRVRTLTSNYVNGCSAVHTFQIFGSDYSEKEFAQGSTRKTIYDHGVIFENLVYNRPYANYTTVPPVFKSNEIEMKSDASGKVSYVTTENPIDLTDYDTIYARMFQASTSTGTNASIIYVNTSTSFDNPVATGMSVLPAKDTVYSVPISELNGSHYISDISAAVRMHTLTELWLE